MIEFPCTLTCDGCGATKEASAKLDALSAVLPMTPFTGIAYDVEIEDPEPWQIIHPGAKVACCPKCYTKVQKEIQEHSHGTARPEAVDTIAHVMPKPNN